MLVERWVYDYLERPRLEVVGEVLTDLSGPDVVDWVRLVSSSELFSDRKAEVAAIAPELRLWGGCEMYPVGLYLKQYAPEVKVRGSFAANDKFFLINSCALAVSAFDRTESEFSEEAKALGVPADFLAGDYFADAPPGTAIVFSGALDGGRFSDQHQNYQHAHHGWELAFDLAKCWDVTTLSEGAFERLVEEQEGYDERTRLHFTEVARHVRRNYRTVRPMSDGRRAATLRALLEHVPVGAKLILLLDHDRQRVHGVVQPDPRTAHYNELVRVSCARTHMQRPSVSATSSMMMSRCTNKVITITAWCTRNWRSEWPSYRAAAAKARIRPARPGDCRRRSNRSWTLPTPVGSPPMEMELKAWSVYARAGPTVLDLVEDFVSMEEYKSRLRAAPDAQQGLHSPVAEHRMSPAAVEEYIASLYATVLKRDPGPDEFAHWVSTAAALPPEQVYLPSSIRKSISFGRNSRCRPCFCRVMAIHRSWIHRLSANTSRSSICRSLAISKASV